MTIITIQHTFNTVKDLLEYSTFIRIDGSLHRVIIFNKEDDTLLLRCEITGEEYQIDDASTVVHAEQVHVLVACITD